MSTITLRILATDGASHLVACSVLEDRGRVKLVTHPATGPVLVTRDDPAALYSGDPRVKEHATALRAWLAAGGGA